MSEVVVNGKRVSAEQFSELVAVTVMVKLSKAVK